MKTYLLSLIMLMVAHSLYSQNDSTKTLTMDSLNYSCSMHPEIQSASPGKCSKCGMDLVWKKSSTTEHKMDMMMCPMHGLVDMNHKHDDKKKRKMMRGVGIGMGVMMVLMMILIHSR
ncbi:MAG: hypothetical protein HYR67_02145 [Bacteroidetes bacterium]|nr:hypothetical protein [Bacteroidota bacterium]